MATNRKMQVAIVAFLLVTAVLAATAPTSSAFGCFDACYERCANGKEGDAGCATMCAQACIVPKKSPDGTDLEKLDD